MKTKFEGFEVSLKLAVLMSAIGVHYFKTTCMLNSSHSSAIRSKKLIFC